MKENPRRARLSCRKGATRPADAAVQEASGTLQDEQEPRTEDSLQLWEISDGEDEMVEGRILHTV